MKAVELPVLQGKTIALSGASGGIGEATALALAARGARILMICRSPERADVSRKKIAAAAAAVQAPAPEVFLADLSRPKEVAVVSAAILKQHPRIDVLINNAGFMGYPRRTLTPEGLEATMATNHLGTFALTMGLLPALKQAAPGARVVTVSSAAHRLPSARFAIEDLNFEKGYGPFAAYARSKLMNVLFTRELALRLQPFDITANCLHPGVVDTGIARTWPAWFRALYNVGRLLMISASKGARTSIYLATDSRASAYSGQYFARCRPARSAQWPGAEALQKALWERSEALVSEG